MVNGPFLVDARRRSPPLFSLFPEEPGRHKQIVAQIDGGMIPPKGSASFVIGAVDKVRPTFSTIKVDFINDYGGVNAKEFPIAVRN